jgi:hypothetical protein
MATMDDVTLVSDRGTGVEVEIEGSMPLHQVDHKIKAAYRFVSDHNLSIRHRASLALATMPTWLYHSRPTRMAFNDLTTRMKPPRNLRSLLGLN